MKDFFDAFRERMDVANGTVQIDRKEYEAIQKEAREEPLRLLAQAYESFILHDDWPEKVATLIGR